MATRKFFDREAGKRWAQVTPLEVAEDLIAFLEALPRWAPGLDECKSDEQLEVRRLHSRQLMFKAIAGFDRLYRIQAEVVPDMQTRGRCNVSSDGDTQRDPLDNLLACTYLCDNCVGYALKALRAMQAELRRRLSVAPGMLGPASGGLQVPATISDDRALIWEDDADGYLQVGDARGTAARVKAGTAAWACLTVLHQLARGKYLPLDGLARAVDVMMHEGACRSAGTADGADGRDGVLDGDERYAGSQMRRGQPRGSKEPYASLSEEVLVDRLQAAIRKATPKGKAWRDRWIHWDAAHGVILESR